MNKQTKGQSVKRCSVLSIAPHAPSLFGRSWLLAALLACFTGLAAAAPDTGSVSADIPVTGLAHTGLTSFDRMMADFVKTHQVPGATLAVARNGRLVYARGFGYADRDRRLPVQPQSLFRIASVSKPFTSAAIMQLVEKGRLRLDDHPFQILNLKPHLAMGQQVDPRLGQITVLQLLQHTGGFDRTKSFDPMFRPLVIARELAVNPPAGPEAIIRYMMGRPLDFDPGTREAYSNFGYCVLGRLIERISGMTYERYVQQQVLLPLAIRDMRLGHTLPSLRANGEVIYYDTKGRTGGSVFPPQVGQQVPLPYGVWNLEAMDAHGGWLASAIDLVRFASDLDNPPASKILSPAGIAQTFARPPGSSGLSADGKPKPVYYACGWMVRHVGSAGRINTWHNGALDGTSSLLVRRHDGLTWAVLFNTRQDQQGKELAGEIDGLVHQAADAVRQWPTEDLFETLMPIK